MAKFDSRIPPAARSLWEVSFDTGKRIRSDANNRDGTTNSAPSTSKAPDRPARDDAFDSIFDRTMYRAVRELTWSLDSASSSPREDTKLRDAREKVKDYILSTQHSTGWNDVVGNEKARVALLEAIEHPVKHKDLFQHYGMTMSKGVLLYGPPGCGKTMFGKAAAAALAKLYGKNVELLAINGPSIQSPWVGETEKTIREIFAYARAYKAHYGHQLVIFIDEADSILRNRSNGPRWNASNVATFLTEMDGLGDSGAFVILATNRPEELDEALLRDGRCDRKIKVERPDYSGALRIAELELTRNAGSWVNGVKATDLVDYLFDPLHLVTALTNPATQVTHHFLLQHLVSGAMVVGLVNRAKGIAMRRDLAAGTVTGLTPEDMRRAVDEVLAESKGLHHDYALREFVETVAIPFEEARRMRGLN